MTEVVVGDTGIEVAGRFTYEWGDRRRPYLHPVSTPAGHCLTRNAPVDHPWHHGLWFTIKLVNGDNFWEEYDEYGVLRHQGAPNVIVDGDRVTLDGALDWIRPDRTTVAVREQRSISYVLIDDDAYAIDFATTLVAPVDTTYDRTPFTTWGGYGGLTVRGRGDWHDTRIRLAGGDARDRVLGEPATWCALDGAIGDADAPVGLAIFSTPTSPRHPTPFYGSTRAETYGDDGWSNFVNAAFLWDKALTVAAEVPLRFSYRVVVHDGIWDEARLDTEYRTFLAR